MRVFVIPSWYPSPSHPNAGIFFKEQAELYAQYFQEDQVGLVSWGQNDERLLLEKNQFFKIPDKLLGAGRIRSSEWEYGQNFMEWFYPQFTWTRKILGGNIRRIIRGCDQAFKNFTIRFGKPELIHAHVGFPGGYIAWKLSEKYKVPFVITEHMGPFPFSDFKVGAGLSSRLLGPFKHSHKILAVSDHLRKEIESYGIISSVFNNFIDDDFFKVKEASSNHSKVRLLHIGRLAPEKRQEDLLQALKLLPTSIDVDLIIAGEGPLRSTLQQKTNDLGLQEKVEFKGNLDRIEIREQLQMADLFVLSSDYENFPVSILEALACGKPVVATRCGGPEEMIHEVNGFLAHPHDPKYLADKLLQAMKGLENFDSNKIRDDFMVRYGRKQAMEKLREVYQQVLVTYHSK